MPLRSEILSGNSRLEAVSNNGAPSVKKRPPDDDVDAVRRIQKALVKLGFPLPLSFPNGPAGEPDGKFGNETFNAVQKFQQKSFPNSFSEWDGRVGKKTLEEMDRQLPAPPPVATMSALAEKDKITSLQWARSAVTSLATVRAFLMNNGSPTPSPLQPQPVRVGLEALETHFRFSTVIGPRVPVIDFISDQYGKAINVLNASSQFFIDDTTTQEAINGVPAHVPFGRGKVNFTPAFRVFNAGTNTGFGPNCRAAMVLHEPIHITDHPFSSTEPTHVHENSPQYAMQTAANQIHNAHSYACFAQHCFFGRDTRFGIGRRAE